MMRFWTFELYRFHNLKCVYPYILIYDAQWWWIRSKIFLVVKKDARNPNIICVMFNELTNIVSCIKKDVDIEILDHVRWYPSQVIESSIREDVQSSMDFDRLLKLSSWKSGGCSISHVYVTIHGETRAWKMISGHRQDRIELRERK